MPARQKDSRYGEPKAFHTVLEGGITHHMFRAWSLFGCLVVVSISVLECAPPSGAPRHSAPNSPATNVCSRVYLVYINRYTGVDPRRFSIALKTVHALKLPNQHIGARPSPPFVSVPDDRRAGASRKPGRATSCTTST